MPEPVFRGVERIKGPVKERDIEAATGPIARVVAPCAEGPHGGHRLVRAAFEARIQVGDLVEDVRDARERRGAWVRVVHGARLGVDFRLPQTLVVERALQTRDPKSVANRLLHRVDVRIVGLIGRNPVEFVQKLNGLRTNARNGHQNSSVAGTNVAKCTRMSSGAACEFLSACVECGSVSWYA